MQNREWEPSCAPLRSAKDESSSAGDLGVGGGPALLFGDGVQLWRLLVDSAIDPETRAEKRRTSEDCDGELSQLEGLVGIRRVESTRRGEAGKKPDYQVYRSTVQ